MARQTYQAGRERPQRAHIVIRRQHVGQAANDVGWERLPDGTYRAWISEYDGRSTQTRDPAAPSRPTLLSRSPPSRLVTDRAFSPRHLPHS